MIVGPVLGACQATTCAGLAAFAAWSYYADPCRTRSCLFDFSFVALILAAALTALALVTAVAVVFAFRRHRWAAAVLVGFSAVLTFGFGLTLSNLAGAAHFDPMTAARIVAALLSPAALIAQALAIKMWEPAPRPARTVLVPRAETQPESPSSNSK